MSKRKILALLLAVAMICSLCVSPALAAEDAGEPVAISDNAGPLFTDIDGHWAESAINRWADYGIIEGDGDGTVRPNRTLKRDELATILTRLLGLKEKAPVGTFTDVPANAWYADAVLKCAAAGIMLGDGAGHANPESTIDRQQTIVMVARALGAKASNSKSLNTFKDGDTVADWAAPYLASLTDMGILNGLPDGDGFVVAPEDNINRAGLFALLDKAIGHYVTTPTTVTANDPNKFVVINADAGEDVTVTGTTAGIVVGAGCTDDVILDNATVGTLKVDAPVDVIIKKGSAVTDLEANAAAKVTNNGTVTTLNTNADDVIFDGNKPAAVNTAEDVEPAKDSKGNEVTPPTTSTGSGSSGGSSSVARADIVAATIADHAETGAIADADLGKVTVTSSKVSGKTNEYNVTITGTNIMNHTNADDNDGHWVGFGMPAAPEGETYTYKLDGTEKPGIAQRTQVVGSKTYNTAYFSAGTEDAFNTAKVVVTVENGDGEVVMTYNVSFKVTFWSAKNVKVVATGADAETAIAALEETTSMPWSHKFAAGLSLTAAVKDTTVTLTGETTKALLQNTDSGLDGGDGYLTYVLQVTDDVIKGFQVGGTKYPSDAVGLPGATQVVNQKFYKGADKEFISNAADFDLVDAAGRVQDTVTVTVDGTQVAIEGMKKVTFKAGDKVLKSVVGEKDDMVSAPAIPEHTDKVYYTGAWLNEADKVVTAPFTVGDADATYTAESAPITDQTFTFRPNGPEGHGTPEEQNFKYAAAYGKAGLTLTTNGVLTLEGATLLKYVANTANATELSHLMHADGETVVCGVAYTVPTGATHVACITNLTDSVTTKIELVSDNDNGTIHGNQPISYIPVANVKDGVVTFKDDAAMDTDYYVWYKGDKVISVTKANLERKTEVPSFKVTFAGCDEAAQTVEYNKTATKPADPTKDLAIFEGWFVGDEAFDFTTPITGNVTVTAKWKEIIELTVTPYDFSCPDGNAQYITYTLKNGNKDFEIAASTVKECWYRENRAADGEWKQDTGVELFAGDIDGDNAFEGMDKAHQLGWTVSRRAEDSTAYWRFITEDGTIYQATFEVPAKIANPTNTAWGDTRITADKPVTAIPVAVPTTPEEEEEQPATPSDSSDEDATDTETEATDET